jgi:hypothetical protein
VLARGTAEAEECPADGRIGALEGVPHGLARLAQLLPDADQEFEPLPVSGAAGR